MAAQPENEHGYWIHNPTPATITHRATPLPDFDPDGDFRVGVAVHEWTRDYFERIAEDS